MKILYRSVRGVAGVAAVSLILAGCGFGGDGKDGSGANSVVETGPVGMQQEATSPTKGGTLRIGTSYPPTGLDPIMVTIDGLVGGAELSAIYDVLVQYDPETRDYSPRLAKSLDSNEGSTEWTLKLRDNVTFSDGTPLDSAAVVQSIDRFQSEPESLTYYSSLAENVADISAPDAATVVFTLHHSDPQFPWVLTQGWGMVTSPTALKEMGQSEFTLRPVGAGPFKVAQYDPNQRLLLTRNPSYHDPESVHLDGVDFTYTPDGNALSQSLRSGDTDAIVLNDPQVTNDALGFAGTSGYAWKRYLSKVLIMNMSDGRPAKNKDLRRAIALSVDPTSINERVYEGEADTTTALFPSGPVENDVDPIEYDPERAKELVNKVKEDTGWDGKLTIVGISSSETIALAIQASLQAVGIDAVVDYSSSYSAMTNKLMNDDFDLTVRAYSVSGAVPGGSIAKSLLQPNAYGGYLKSDNDVDQMSAALNKLDQATSSEELAAAGGEVQKIWNEQIPAVSFASISDMWLWDGNSVFGMTPTAETTILVADAWKKN